MNNAWSIALRLPCRGLRSSAPSQWVHSSLLARDGGAIHCATSITSAIARQRQQLLRRGFATSSPQYAKQTKKRASRPSSTPPKPSSGASQPTPPKPQPTREAAAPASQTPKPEKAQVQLSKTQVAAILGPGLSFDQGMELLQEIQYRRVTGSLSDKGLEFPDSPDFTQEHRTQALEWLRDNYPVDEEAAAIEYAEEAAEELRRDLQERAKRLRLYKRDEEAEVEENQEEEVVPDEQYGKIPVRADQTRDITGESALHARKQYVEASRKKAEIEAEKEAAEYEARGEQPPEPYKGHDLVVAKKTALETASKLKYERWQKLEEEAQLKEEDLLANRSAFSRLWAPTLFGLTVAGLSWIYAESYEPPKSSMRLFPSISPATATVLGLAGINLALVLLWRHPSAWKMMNRNFLLSPGHPNAFSVLGGLFSHQQFSHWMWNMSMLYIVGVPIHEEIGRGAFLSLYLSTGILGYLTSLTFNVVTRSYLSATLGSSAAIFGLVGAYFTISETRSLRLPDALGGDINYASWIPLLTIVGWELVRWRLNRGVIDGVAGGTDYLTHLGGVVAGAVSGWILRRRLAAERKEDEEVIGRD